MKIIKATTTTSDIVFFTILLISLIVKLLAPKCVAMLPIIKEIEGIKIPATIAEITPIIKII